MRRWFILGVIGVLLLAGSCRADDDTVGEDETVEVDIGKSRDGSRTDDEVVEREEEAIKLDGLSVAQMKEFQESAEKHVFQAEVNRMMKLIINSLYKNKEIFLRELISNASDALDKIRFLSLTDKDALESNPVLNIKIKADKENHVLHVTDSGVGMTRDDLVNNLGTIARSGTSEFLSKMGDATDAQLQDLIGQFGVGFYSSFLIADKVIVTSKHNSDEQYIWESDAQSFSIARDPRGNTLGRGTTVSLHLKEEAYDFLEPDTVKDLIKRYSQFISFDIFLWTSKTEMVDEPVDEDEEEAAEEEEKPDTDEDEDEDVKVEEEEDEEEAKQKTKQVEKTTWDWELMNSSKPIWTRKPAEVNEEEYNEFYRQFTKDTADPMGKIHFIAEGEVTFKSILFIPNKSSQDLLQNFGKKVDQIKLYVRRVFITSDFAEMMPNYLAFIRGMVDSDDLPLNVSRETLQQHKLLKVIKKKLTRKALDMIKKIDEDKYDAFWKEYSTFIKLGVIEDASNRTRLSKLLRFATSHSDDALSSLADYVERMREKQEAIYFVAGTSRADVEKSPFVERLLKKGYEVIYLTEAVDEYCVQAMPEFEGKRFQNVAKEGLKVDESEKSSERKEAMEKEYEPLLKWLKEKPLSDKIEKAVISERLSDSPCALVASQYGWSGNMERLVRSQAYAKRDDPTQQFYLNQKKTLEVNPRHPVIKELLRRVETEQDDPTTQDLAMLLFDTATMRSGFTLPDSYGFATRIEKMLRLSMNISPEEKIDEWPEDEEADEDNEAGDEDEDDNEEDEDDEDEDDNRDDHDEL